MKWSYARPLFEYNQGGIDILNSWVGHKNFAYDLVSAIKPRKIVELGTHYGTSFFSMCQAVKDRGLSTELLAVDTWQGDYQAGYYQEEVFEKVTSLVSGYYSDLSIKLLRKTFDEALTDVADKSVDILHIDGLHTYDAVRHDFETWLPKVASHGIILFHDIHTRQSDFGVYIFWDELKKIYPTMEFYHSYGLGILFLDSRTRDAFAPFEMVWQRYYSLLDDHTRYTQETANLSHQMKEKERIIFDISQTVEHLTQQNLISEEENKTLKDEVETKHQEFVRSSLELQDLVSKFQFAETEKKILAEQVRAQQEAFFNEYKNLQSEVISIVGKLNQQSLLLREKEEEKKNSIEKNKLETDRLVEKFREELSLKDTALAVLSEKEQEILLLRDQISGISTMFSEKNYEVALMRASKFWKLRDIYMRSKWAVFHPFKFIKKYIKKICSPLTRVLSKISYLLEHTTRSFHRDGFWIMTIRIKNYILHGKGRVMITKEFQAPSFGGQWKDIARLPEKKISSVSKKEKPVVSIIIPVHNQIEYTLQCLKSMAYVSTHTLFEVIVVNDASTDSTHTVLSRRSDIVYLKNSENKGFIGSCNYAASKARGEYLFFLNNDTVVLDNWLDSSVKFIASDSSIGLVGSKLVYPDGKLQEAGGIVWSDASAWNYGRGSDPHAPEYNFVRDVDYCSGAAILVRNNLFQKLGGFDTRYTPAYYEDTDLAFSIRKLGFRTIYNPFSQIVHFEGITGGTDIEKGVKSYQVKNQAVFQEKWKDELSQLGLYHEKSLLQDSSRISKKRMLIIDQTIPTPDQDAGSIYITNTIKILINLHYHITFIPCSNLGFLSQYTEALQALGVESLYAPYISSVESFLKAKGRDYDVVMIVRAPTAIQYLDMVKSFCPQAKVIFNTQDVHYLSLERQAEQKKSSFLKEQARKLKEEELSVMRRVDKTIVVSPVEKSVLRKEIPNAAIDVIHLIREIPDYIKRNRNLKTCDLLFIGGFNHTPNGDAVHWFCKAIFPLVLKKVPHARFHIVGSNAPSDIQSLASDNIIVHGYVQDLGSLIERVTMTIAPLRFGAGQKGKILDSLSLGTPCVTTSLGAEGMSMAHNKEILVADTPEDFSKMICRLYQNEDLWNTLSKNGHALVKREFSIEHGKKAIQKLLDSLI